MRNVTKGLIVFDSTFIRDCFSISFTFFSNIKIDGFSDLLLNVKTHHIAMNQNFINTQRKKYFKNQCESLGGKFNGKTCCMEYKKGTCVYTVKQPPNWISDTEIVTQYYKKYLIVLHVLIVIGMLIYFWFDRNWQIINKTLYITAVFLVIYSRYKIKKTFLLIIGFTITFLIVGNVYKMWIVKNMNIYDTFIDVISHFTVGVLAFFILHLLFPKKHISVIFLYATLFAVLYEITEALVFEYIETYDLEWNSMNMMFDFAVNMFGSLLAMMIEYHLMKRKNQYIQ